MDCSCDRCQGFCRNKPGWFTPDQIPVVARWMNLSVEDLFHKYLTIDAVLIGNSEGPSGIYILAPAVIQKKSGSISDPKDKGVCVFFHNGECAIHPVKPRECGALDHMTSPAQSNLVRLRILEQWRFNKEFLQKLYGKKLKLPKALKDEYRRVRGAGGKRMRQDSK